MSSLCNNNLFTVCLSRVLFPMLMYEDLQGYIPGRGLLVHLFILLIRLIFISREVETTIDSFYLVIFIHLEEVK